MLHWSEIRAKYLKFGPYEIWAGVIILLAVALRIALIALGWPQLDSDEGTMGIMAMHILSRGEHPVFFYMQGYMGSLEAYIAAGLFALFGISTFTLRVGLIFLFALFLVGMYLLTSMLYNRKWALITLGFLCLGSAPILTRELVAIGGYPETLMFGSFLLLLALWLAFSSKPDHSSSSKWRLLAFGIWGLIAGVAFWTDALIAPFILTGGLMILLFCWRELLGWASAALMLGTLLGISPMIPYNLTVPADQTTLAYLQNIQKTGVLAPSFYMLFPFQLKGALFISLPGATGANPLCATKTMPLQGVSVPDIHPFQFDSPQAIHCTLVHTGWALGMIALSILAIALAIRALWLLYRSPEGRWSPTVRQDFIRHSGRLALMLNAVIVFLLFVVSPAAALFPVPDMRYLEGVLVSIPALFWPLWNGIGLVKPLALKFWQMTLAVRLALISLLARRGLLALLGAVFLLGTFSTFSGIPPAPPVEQRQDKFAVVGVYQYQGVPATRAFNAQETELIDNLLRIHATHIYSDYWTCDRLIFRSQERIICSVTRIANGQLRTGQNRYEPYVSIVKSDSHAAYVFQVGSPEAALKERHYWAAKDKYERYVFNGYVIIRPK